MEKRIAQIVGWLFTRCGAWLERKGYRNCNFCDVWGNDIEIIHYNLAFKRACPQCIDEIKKECDEEV
jgi:hypothetical protein